MPRQSRIDAPGALYHLIIRGIEQKAIFKDDADRYEFIERVASIFSETDTPCFAWVLMTNHVHLLTRTAATPIATLMRRLLTGYLHSVRQGAVGGIRLSSEWLLWLYCRL
jgi:REP element-mobilizing transposase RayT